VEVERREHLNLSKHLIAALLALGAMAPSFADQYPSKAVTVIVPFPPGGGIDVMIRAVAAELSAKWGKPVIIENKGGAGTLIGAEAVARATPDGYTLLATIDQTMVANRFLYQKLPYDADKSFLPITLMAESDHMILANPAVPAKDLRELVALAKREKGKLNFGSFGDGSQPVLVYGLLNKREGLDITHVPYRGVSPLMIATVAGEVQLATASASVAGELLKAKRIKALATAGKTRSPQFPDVPTTAEQGYPYLRSSVWYGLFAPAGTPPEIIKKINADVTAILKTPAFAERNGTSKGLQVVASSPKEFSDRIREDVATTGEMVRAANIKPQ
jgi:tripartite-type tricarboxylate transporter receptor subunit TctC